MISIEEGIYWKLKNDSGVYGKVGERIYPLKLPHTVVLPAIVYTRISSPRESTHDESAGGLAMPRFQFDIYGETYSSVKEIAKLIRSAIKGFRGEWGSGTKKVKVYGVLSADEQDTFEPDANLYLTMVDYFIHHEE